MAYGKIHRYLLRSIASLGVLSVTDAKRILTSFTGKYFYKQKLIVFHFNCKSWFKYYFIDEEISSVQDLVKEINDEIRPLQQEIKITNDELTNEEVVVFLSLGYDDATKAQNIFSATELEYFRVLIEQIMTTEARQITGIHAINLVGGMKASFTKTDAQVSI